MLFDNGTAILPISEQNFMGPDFPSVVPQSEVTEAAIQAKLEDYETQAANFDPNDELMSDILGDCRRVAAKMIQDINQHEKQQ